jgi:FkbM family methyltransferase
MLDVGAHRGEHSYWMHRTFGGDARIVTFEPQPELAMFLTDFKQSFGLDRMTIVPFGLSSRGGKLRMHRPRLKWASATLDEFCNDDARPKCSTCRSLRSMSICRSTEAATGAFIKCDVESHETEVLTGAERIFRQRGDRPASCS